jgi:alpha-N-arabinofuranosidase
MDGPALPRKPRKAPNPRDEFDARSLAPGWMFVRNPARGSWSLRERPGFLRLRGLPGSLSDTSPLALVCRRQQHLEVTVRARMEFEPEAGGQQAGLCVRANENFYAALLVAIGTEGRELRLVRAVGGRLRTLGRQPLADGPVTLAIEATAREYVFSGGAAGSLHPLGRVATTALSAETILRRSGRNHFTGAMLGLFASGNGATSTVPADFDWFEYIPAS